MRPTQKEWNGPGALEMPKSKHESAIFAAEPISRRADAMVITEHSISVTFTEVASTSVGFPLDH